MRRIVLLSSALSVAAMLAVGVAPGAVQAASQLTANAAPARNLHIGPPNGSTTSGNWAGYAATTAGTKLYKKVEGSWVEPSVTCPTNNALAAFWVGLDGFNSQTVEQDGSIAICNGSTAKYYVWWEMYPFNAVKIVAQISAGDHISAQVVYNSGHYKLSVQDATHPSANFTRTKVGTCPCARNSSEWIAEAPSDNSGILPLANFGTMSFSGSETVEGTGGFKPISSFPNDRIDMVGSSDTKASTGALNGAGTGFSVTWHNAT